MIDDRHLYKKCLRMWEVWANQKVTQSAKIAQSGHTDGGKGCLRA